MNLNLTEEQKIIKQMCHDYAVNKLRGVAAKHDREGTFPVEMLKELAEMGLMGINIPEKYGGAEAGVIAYSLALTEIAKEHAAVAVTMSVTNMVAEILNMYGNEEQKKKYIPLITSGEAIAGSFALTEPSYGSDAAHIKTKAVKSGDKYIINGEKLWITSGGYSKVIIVFARTEEIDGAKGISAFIVTPDMPGFTVGREEEKMGLKASNTVSLLFEDCEVPEKNLLGKRGEGFKIAMSALDGGRIGIASQALGIAKGAFEEAVRYSIERKQFGVPIYKHQSISNYISEMATMIDAGELLLMRACFLKENGKSFTKEASMAKVFNSEMANQVCAYAIQIHGGYGYSVEYPVERYYREARVTTIYEGTSEIQRIVIARKILDEFSRRGGL